MVNNRAMNEQKINELWSHLHWLTVLAQQGSYTAAAARLGVSKAAMSQRMADLEQMAGVPLVRRTTRSVRLTEAGQLCGTRSVLVASRSYLRKRGTPLRPEDLRNHSCLHYPRAQDTPAWTFAQGTGSNVERVTVPVSGVLSANNSEALRDAAVSGLGIALLPDFSLPASLRASKLALVLPDWQLVGGYADQLYAIRPYTAHVPRAVTAFVNYLRQALAGGFAQELDEI
jgi:DNA-binding transcriptional LysR family regulator